MPRVRSLFIAQGPHGTCHGKSGMGPVSMLLESASMFNLAHDYTGRRGPGSDLVMDTLGRKDLREVTDRRRQWWVRNRPKTQRGLRNCPGREYEKVGKVGGDPQRLGPLRPGLLMAMPQLGVPGSRVKPRACGRLRLWEVRGWRPEPHGETSTY